MIVGAAGIVTGLIVDEDILTIAGAGVALGSTAPHRICAAVAGQPRGGLPEVDAAV
jgi:hypothetical protein